METDPEVLLDRAAGAILGVFIGDALGVGVHWQYDLDKLERERGYVTGYLDPLPGTFHSGTDDAPGKGQLKAGQLEQQGEVTKLLLKSLASKHCLDQNDFHDCFEKEILLEDSMDGTRKGGKYGWTDKTICDVYKARILNKKPWPECVLPRSDTPDTIVRAALIAAAYFLNPRAMCCHVQAHSKALTCDSRWVGLKEFLHAPFCPIWNMPEVLGGKMLSVFSLFVEETANKVACRLILSPSHACWQASFKGCLWTRTCHGRSIRRQVTLYLSLPSTVTRTMTQSMETTQSLTPYFGLG